MLLAFWFIHLAYYKPLTGFGKKHTLRETVIFNGLKLKMENPYLNIFIRGNYVVLVLTKNVFTRTGSWKIIRSLLCLFLRACAEEARQRQGPLRQKHVPKVFWRSYKKIINNMKELTIKYVSITTPTSHLKLPLA